MTARVMLGALFEAALRNGHTIRVSDGGFVSAFGQDFTSEDSIYGSIGACEPLSEGVADEVPALRITFLPKNGGSIPTLAQPINQRSRVKAWIAEVDSDSGLVVGTPTLMFNGVLERLGVKFGRNLRTVEMEIAANGVLLLNRYEGNARSESFHRRVWPGEAGEDNRSGLGVSVAWGAPSPPRGTTGYAGNGVVGGGGRGLTERTADR